MILIKQSGAAVGTPVAQVFVFAAFSQEIKDRGRQSGVHAAHNLLSNGVDDYDFADAVYHPRLKHQTIIPCDTPWASRTMEQVLYHHISAVGDLSTDRFKISVRASPRSLREAIAAQNPTLSCSTPPALPPHDRLNNVQFQYLHLANHASPRVHCC